MSWFYADGKEEQGPVPEMEFGRLVESGFITAETLVWREGMAEWEPYGRLAGVSAGERERNFVPCSRCGRTFPVDDVIELMGQAVCASCKTLAVQELREVGRLTDAGAENLRKAHISHEASIKSVGVLYFISGFFMAVAGIAILLGGAAGDDELSLGAATVGSVFLFAFAGGMFATGLGLRRLRRWARIPVGILSGLGLLNIPLGTLINGYILYLVFGKKGQTVFSDEYRDVIAATPHVKYKTSIVVWIFLALLLGLIAIGIVAALLAG